MIDSPILIGSLRAALQVLKEYIFRGRAEPSYILVPCNSICTVEAKGYEWRIQIPEVVQIVPTISRSDSQRSHYSVNALYSETAAQITELKRTLTLHDFPCQHDGYRREGGSIICRS
jgi:hypothetical protein